MVCHPLFLPIPLVNIWESPILWAAVRGRKWQDFAMLAWLVVSVFALHRLLADQYPLRDIVSGINYYRRIGLTPVLQGVIPAATLLAIAFRMTRS